MLSKITIFFILILKIILVAKVIIVNNNKVNLTNTLVSNFIKFIIIIYKIEKSSFLIYNIKQTFI